VTSKGKGRRASSPLDPLRENEVEGVEGEEGMMEMEEDNDDESEDLDESDAVDNHEGEHSFSGPLHYVSSVEHFHPKGASNASRRSFTHNEESPRRHTPHR